MPIEFTQYPSPENTGVSGDTLFRLTVAYDGTGRRISKTRWVKAQGDAGWSRGHVTHYTGIGTEVRENFAGESPETKVVVNMPQGLGRYGIENADHVAENGSAQTFEWYLKNHLGSTMLVYGTGAGTPGGLKAAYDYRSFGEQVTLTESADKVTENFTGKERDDETELNYFGARYLDPMLGMWTSVDPARQFASPYLYAGNGVNPVNVVDPDGNETTINLDENNRVLEMAYTPNGNTTVTFYKPGVEPFTAAEPPQGSYFYTQGLRGEIFDFNMESNAGDMLEDAYMLYPVVDAPYWGSREAFDFKYTYYQKKGESEYTIGVLNGTAMTARDAGNAMWGGWFRNMYVPSQRGMKEVADWVANRDPKNGGRGEDPGSAVMQRWGYDNFNPTEHIGFGTFLIKALLSPR